MIELNLTNVLYSRVRHMSPSLYYMSDLKRKLTNLDKSFYHSEKNFNQVQLDKVYDLMRQIMASKIERLLQKVSKITQNPNWPPGRTGFQKLRCLIMIRRMVYKEIRRR